ncbi:GALS1 [Symbiodinium sp. CCMP2592]|nr:GALS1 [Symbiodinium sp. CCMP2592]
MALMHLLGIAALFQAVTGSYKAYPIANEGGGFSSAACVRKDCTDSDHVCLGEQEETVILQVQRSLPSSSGTTSRDLATIPDPGQFLNSTNIALHLLSVVPSFGDTSNFVAVLFQYNQRAWEALTGMDVFCSDAAKSHRTKATVWGGERKGTARFAIVVRCEWPASPASQAHESSFDMLIEGNGQELGQVQVQQSHIGMLEQYGTVACIPGLWNGEISAPSIIPQWMEFYLLHGVDHFIVYTSGITHAAVLEMYEPYIKAGVATRVHVNTTGKYAHGDAHKRLIMNDCLYRMKNHAQWLMPSVDVDEYIRLADNDSVGDYMRTAWDKIASEHAPKLVHSISMARVRFDRPLSVFYDNLLVNTSFRFPVSWSCPKYLVRPTLVNGVDIHYPISWENGTQISIPMSQGFAAHYRVVHGPADYAMIPKGLVTVRDETLLADSPRIGLALENRFNGKWPEIEKKLRAGSDDQLSQFPA